ncbi:MAG TPA: CsbD family protein [Blastocatellia bacterium]|nr:CsbD family protein [Blastocatellia bacterium]
MLNKDELKGKGKKIKGTIKEEVGKVTWNRDLEQEGQTEREEGEVREGFGKARRKVGEAVEKVGKTVSR